jgi:hypothetical protein
MNDAGIFQRVAIGPSRTLAEDQVFPCCADIQRVLRTLIRSGQLLIRFGQLPIAEQEETESVPAGPYCYTDQSGRAHPPSRTVYRPDLIAFVCPVCGRASEEEDMDDDDQLELLRDVGVWDEPTGLATRKSSAPATFRSEPGSQPIDLAAIKPSRGTTADELEAFRRGDRGAICRACADRSGFPESAFVSADLYRTPCSFCNAAATHLFVK